MGDDKDRKEDNKGFLKSLTKKQKTVFGIASVFIVIAIATVAYLGFTGQLKIKADVTSVPLKATMGMNAFIPGITSSTFKLGFAPINDNPAITQYTDATDLKKNMLITQPECIAPSTGGYLDWRMVYEALDADGKVLARQFGNAGSSGYVSSPTDSACYSSADAVRVYDDFAYPPGTSSIRIRRLKLTGSTLAYNLREENQQIVYLTSNVNQGLTGSYSAAYGGSNCQPGPGQIAVFESKNYGGRCTLMNAGDFANAGEWSIEDGGFAGSKTPYYLTVRPLNDLTSSIKVNQAKVTVYDGANYAGTSKEITVDTPDLGGSGLNDAISSAKVQSLVMILDPNPVEMAVGETKIVTSSVALPSTNWFSNGGTQVTGDATNTTANAYIAEANVTTQTSGPNIGQATVTQIAVKGLKVTAAGTYATVKILGANGSFATLKIKVNSTTTTSTTGTLSIDSFVANPTHVTAGGTSTLTWALTGATANTKCSIDQNVGDVTGITSKSKVVTVQADTKYTLTCTDDPTAGTATKTATVTVTVPTCAISITGAKATPATIPLGNTSTLSWTATASGGGCINENIVCTLNGSAASSGTVVKPTAVGTIPYGLSCSSEHAATVNDTINVTVTGSLQCGSGQVAFPAVTGKWWVKTMNTVPTTGRTLAQIMSSANPTYFFDGFGTAYGKGDKATATDYIGLGFWLKKKTNDGHDYICVDSASAVGKSVTKLLPHQALNMIGTPLAAAINPHRQLKFKFSSVPDKTYTLDEAFASGYVKAFFIWDGAKYLPYTNISRYPSYAKYGYQSYTKITDTMTTTEGAWLSTRSTETVTLVVE